MAYLVYPETIPDKDLDNERIRYSDCSNHTLSLFWMNEEWICPNCGESDDD